MISVWISVWDRGKVSLSSEKGCAQQCDKFDSVLRGDDDRIRRGRKEGGGGGIHLDHIIFFSHRLYKSLTIHRLDFFKYSEQWLNRIMS